jgi:hypothetical protein
MPAYPVHFIAALPCMACQQTSTGPDTQLVTYGLHPDAGNYVAAPGDVLALEDFDIEGGYHRTHAPLDAERIEALEQWVCPRCGQLGYARISFTPADGGWRIEAIEASALTPEVLREVPLVCADLPSLIRHHPSLAWLWEFMGP